MAGEPVNDITKYKDARYWCKKVMEDTEFKHELNPDYRQVFINLAQDKYDTKESICVWRDRDNRRYERH